MTIRKPPKLIASLMPKTNAHRRVGGNKHVTQVSSYRCCVFLIMCLCDAPEMEFGESLSVKLNVDRV